MVSLSTISEHPSTLFDTLHENLSLDIIISNSGAGGRVGGEANFHMWNVSKIIPAYKL